MKKILKVFNSHQEADRADIAYYAALSPQERLSILLELVARYAESSPDAAKRFERVHRIIDLSYDI